MASLPIPWRNVRRIGIRVALGARRREIVQMVLREGMLMGGGGIVVGTLAALAMTRLMQNLLYDVEPHDTATFATVVLSLFVTTLAACCGPALKAALLDPVIALRRD